MYKLSIDTHIKVKDSPHMWQLHNLLVNDWKLVTKTQEGRKLQMSDQASMGWEGWVVLGTVADLFGEKEPVSKSTTRMDCISLYSLQSHITKSGTQHAKSKAIAHTKRKAELMYRYRWSQALQP